MTDESSAMMLEIWDMTSSSSDFNKDNTLETEPGFYFNVFTQPPTGSVNLFGPYPTREAAYDAGISFITDTIEAAVDAAHEEEMMKSIFPVAPPELY